MGSADNDLARQGESERAGLPHYTPRERGALPRGGAWRPTERALPELVSTSATAFLQGYAMAIAAIAMLVLAYLFAR